MVAIILASFPEVPVVDWTALIPKATVGRLVDCEGHRPMANYGHCVESESSRRFRNCPSTLFWCMSGNAFTSLPLLGRELSACIQILYWKCCLSILHGWDSKWLVLLSCFRALQRWMRTKVLLCWDWEFWSLSLPLWYQVAGPSIFEFVSRFHFPGLPLSVPSGGAYPLWVWDGERLPWSLL